MFTAYTVPQTFCFLGITLFHPFLTENDFALVFTCLLHHSAPAGVIEPSCATFCVVRSSPLSGSGSLLSTHEVTLSGH